MAEMEDLKKTGKLKDGTEVLLRPMVKADREMVGDFFGRLTPSVLQYVRHDVTNPKVLDKWFDQLDYQKAFPVFSLCKKQGGGQRNPSPGGPRLA